MDVAVAVRLRAGPNSWWGSVTGEWGIKCPARAAPWGKAVPAAAATPVGVGTCGVPYLRAIGIPMAQRTTILMRRHIPRTKGHVPRAGCVREVIHGPKHRSALWPAWRWRRRRAVAVTEARHIQHSVRPNQRPAPASAPLSQPLAAMRAKQQAEIGDDERDCTWLTLYRLVRYISR